MIRHPEPARASAPAAPPFPATAAAWKPAPPSPLHPYQEGPPDPEAVAVVGRFGPWPWKQFPDEAYLAQAIEALGIKVIRVDQEARYAPAPAALWVVGTAYPASMEKLGRWAGIRKTILWTLDWLLHDRLREPSISAAQHADLFASSDRYNWSGARGIRRHLYLPGACERPRPVFDPRPSRPCAFMGSVYSDRRRRIANLVRSMGGTVLDHPGTWLYGQDLAKFVQETKVVVGDNSTNDVQGYWSSRNYVVPGQGGFLLTPRVPGLSEQLEPGKHLAVYDSEGDLGRELASWIALDAEREKIRRQGFEHVRTFHTWEERAKVLLQAIDVLAEQVL
jgi:hypothetical protein